MNPEENRVKLMLVGQENVGKTSLLLALKNCLEHGFKKRKPVGKRTTSVSAARATQISGDTLSTDGIDIERVELNQANIGELQKDKEKEKDKKDKKDKDKDTKNAAPVSAKNVVFNVWDFGGQEVYYTTHSFFLSDRSIYLVVWNILDEQSSRIQYWLNAITIHAPKAPIVLVATHLDEKKKEKKDDKEAAEIVEEKLQKFKANFKNLKASFAVSTQTNKNMDELVSNLYNVAVKILEPYQSKPVNLAYFQLEQFIAVERDNLVKSGKQPLWSWEQFFDAAKRFYIVPRDKTLRTATDTDTKSLRQVADHLHLLGVVYIFNPDTMADSPRKLVILDMTWIAKVFATVCSTKHGYIKTGAIPHNALTDQLWREYPKDLHNVLISIFETFEIMYRLPVDPSLTNYSGDMFLVPSMLPDIKPADVLEMFQIDVGTTGTQYHRRYKFEFVPTGLVSRFIIKMMKFANAKRFWRSGILIQSKTNANTVGLIELKPEFLLMEFRVKSTEESADFFAHICEAFEFLVDHGFRVQNRVDYMDPSTKQTFTREQLEAISIKGIWVIQSGKHKIQMTALAPELALTNANSLQVDLDKEVQLGDKVGEGAFASVYAGLYRNEQVAVKRLNMAGKSEDHIKKIFEEFRREVTTMSALRHPCVVNLRAFSLQMPFSLIMELVPHGSLHGFLKTDPDTPLSWTMRLRIAYDIASAMAHLHSYDPPLIHKDLKSPNVLMASLAENAPVVAKVADFGITGKLYLEKFRAQKARDREVENPTWLAPEIIREEPYTAAADVYPFGIMLWELLTRQHPFAHLGTGFSYELEEAIKRGDRPAIPDDCPPMYSQLVIDCWDGNPQIRPSFQQIVDYRLPELIALFAPELNGILAQAKGVHSGMEEVWRQEREQQRKEREQKRLRDLEDRRNAVAAALAEQEPQGGFGGLGDINSILVGANIVGSGGESMAYDAPRTPTVGVSVATPPGFGSPPPPTNAPPPPTNAPLPPTNAPPPPTNAPPPPTNAPPPPTNAPPPPTNAPPPPTNAPPPPTNAPPPPTNAPPPPTGRPPIPGRPSDPTLTVAPLKAPVKTRPQAASVGAFKGPPPNFIPGSPKKLPPPPGERPLPPPGVGTPPLDQPAGTPPGPLKVVPKMPFRPVAQSVASPLTGIALPGFPQHPPPQTPPQTPPIQSNTPPQPTIVQPQPTVALTPPAQPENPYAHLTEPDLASAMSARGLTVERGEGKTAMIVALMKDDVAKGRTSPTPATDSSRTSPNRSPSPGIARAPSPSLSAPNSPVARPSVGAAKAPLLPVGIPRSTTPPLQSQSPHATSSSPTPSPRPSLSIPASPRPSLGGASAPKRPAPIAPHTPAGVSNEITQGGYTIVTDNSTVTGPMYKYTSSWSAAKQTAGGPPASSHHWRKNPQFFLTVTAPTKLKIILSQADTETLPNVGIFVLKASPDGLKTLDLQGSFVYQPPVFAKLREIDATLKLPAGHYNILPCASLVGAENTFHLNIQGPNLTVAPAKEWLSVDFNGEWTAQKAGGTTQFPSWTTNPQYLIRANGPTKLYITLNSERRDIGAGFVVYQNGTASIMCQSPLSTVFSSQLLSVGQGDFVVMPTTYFPGDLANYSLRVFHSTPCSVQAV